MKQILHQHFRKALPTIVTLAVVFLAGCSSSDGTLANVIGTNATNPAALDLQSVLTVMSRVIDIMAGFGGIVTIFMMIAGYQLLLSAGETDGQTKAKETIRYAAVGMVVIVFAYAIVKMLFIVLANSAVVQQVLPGK